jgi:hypothetical protein
MSADDQLRKVLREYDEDFNDKGTVWRVQGTAVISHKALERIAAKAGIKYASPTIIRAERDEAVLLVSGTLGDRMEWSIGEALVNVNYRVSGKQAGYVWAMAEKRAKDRVILKLVSLHGLAYSEEEADEFKNQPVPQRQSDRHINEDAAQDDEPSWSQMAAQSMADALLKRAGPAVVEAFLARDQVKDALSRLEMDDHTWVMRIAAERRAVEPVTSGVAA